MHVAILGRPYDRLLLEGAKRIESRFTKVDCPPFGCVKPGERIFFKRSGGSFFATAVVARVLMADRLTPRAVDELVEWYNEQIRGEEAYWKAKRGVVKYATLMWLREVEPTTLCPAYKPQNMRAWYVLDDEADPLGKRGEAARPIEVELTAGCLRYTEGM